MMKSFADLKKGETVYVEWVGGSTIAKTCLNMDAGGGLSIKCGDVEYDPKLVFSTWRGIFNISNGLSAEGERSICHLPSDEIEKRYKQSPNVINGELFGRGDGEYCNL